MSTHTIYHFQYKRENTLNYHKSAAMECFPKGLKNEFETAVINESSVFEPLKFYCIKKWRGVDIANSTRAAGDRTR